MSHQDQEKLQQAQQAANLAVAAMKQLVGADDPLLSEIALDQLDLLVKVDIKMQRLLSLQERFAGLGADKLPIPERQTVRTPPDMGTTATPKNMASGH